MWQGSGGLGYGQTWQLLTGSRALASGYTNLTGKPIFVFVSLLGPGGTNPHAFINGMDIGECAGGTSTWVQGACSFVVPNNTSYGITNIGGGAPTIISWAELR